MSNVDKLANRRRIGVMVCASAFLVWQVPLMDFSERLAARSGLDPLNTVISLLGFFVWIAVLLMLIGRWRPFTSNPEVLRALNDELTQANRKRAFVVGYTAMMLCSGFLFALSLFVPVAGVEAAHLILVVGVVAPLYSFAGLERVGANE